MSVTIVLIKFNKSVKKVELSKKWLAILAINLMSQLPESIGEFQFGNLECHARTCTLCVIEITGGFLI